MASRTQLRPGSGTQPVDGRSRRQDEPALTATRYDAPSGTGSHQLELPAAHTTRFRAGSAWIGTMRDAGRSEIKA